MHGYVMGLRVGRGGETQGSKGCPINPEIVLQLLVISQFHDESFVVGQQVPLCLVMVFHIVYVGCWRYKFQSASTTGPGEDPVWPALHHRHLF